MQKSISRRLLRVAICLAVLVCTLLLPAAQAAPDGTSTIELVVRTPRYQMTEAGLSVPDYAAEDAPGMPRLPVYGTLVELPATGSWEIVYQSVGSRVLDQHVAVQSVPVPELSFDGPGSWTLRAEEELPGSVPAVDRPDPGVYRTNGFHPASLVASGDVVWQGGKRLLPLRVYPFQYNPVAGVVRYHPEIRIQVKLKEADAAAQPEAVADAGPALAAPQALTGTAGVLRIRTAAAGMVRLTYDELAAKGVPLGSTDTATFAMTYLGQPVDIRVLDGGNSRLDPGELVVFYAEAASGRYNTNNVYFFSYGGAAGTRMASRNVTPTGSEPALTSIIRTTRVENDRVYYSDYPIPTSADHFFDDPPLYPTTSTPVSTLAYPLSLIDPVTTGAVAFRGRFYGGQAQGANPDQSVQVSLNSQAVGAFRWDGRTGYDAAATAPASGLSTASNTLSVRAALAQLPGLTGYWVYVDWVELDYPARATAQADRLYIKGLGLAGTAVKVQTTGFSTGDVAVYDVRDPRHPVVIGRTQASATAPYDLSFWDAWAAGAPAPSYFLATPAGLAAPAAVEVASLPAWNTPANSYDYIAIVHRSLWDAVQPLLDHRAALGLRVAKVDVQDIYDEFSGGLVDPEAIRSFLSYAYHNWNGTGPRPRYVLLVGDGHYDFKNVTGTPQLNLIPPYLIAIDPWIGETAADNRYVSVDGPADFMPDMAIGRIPAQTAADVTAAVDKILAYENPSQTPDGAWQSRVTFVADRATDPAGNFQALSDDVRLNWLPATYTNRHIYWGTDYTVAYPPPAGANMNDAIKAAFTDSIMLQWFGHASRFIWGSTQVFSSFSVKAIPTSPQWPFSTDYSCWSGYFINLYNFYGDYRTAAEAALLTPAKGSVAVLAPSGLHVGSAVLTLNQGLVKAVFQDRIRPVGDAVDAAKAYYYANAGASRDVIDTMVFFGDPAMPLRLPAATSPTPTPVTPTATPVTPTATPVTPTATPVTPTATPVTPTATPSKSVHVGDLGISKATAKTGWTATVTILVHDQSEKPVSGATVSGSWSGPYNGAGTCTTNASGTCSITVTITRSGSETYTVSNVSLTGDVYLPGSNHDSNSSNGASNGTTISVTGSKKG